ncbi:HNH endonuclease [Pusillimonas sp. DMV24BSW_D]|uniref:HNH endonuclease n=1 Tax=Neopusillimonas aestuarii TaxID=2716226 RepID=UPI00140B5A97|nr:HNH endonuclease [Pusillimonas sp. DMV24BSW_D]QIM48348.1 HNH endonuclease [Pusillimonas sp. DMV24BSW_D]
MAKDWSEEELLAAVDAYRQMAKMQEAGVTYSKKHFYEDLASRFERSAKAFEYRMQNISAVLDELGLPWIPGLKPAVNVGTAIKAKLIEIIQGDALQKQIDVNSEKESRTWEKALDAVNQLGGIAGRKQVEDWILAHHPEYNSKNLTDLYMLSVNSPARTGYLQNRKPRRTDQDSRYDKLFKIGKSTFELYDPAQHGVWEIYADASSGNRFGVSIRQVSNPIDNALITAEKNAERAIAFDPINVNDARQRISTDIIRRRGQPTFRKALLVAYDNTCAVTGCNLSAVLEAAHIHPYKGDHTNVVSNGLLLRADIHTLFDLGLIAVDSETMTVRVSPELASTSYGKLDGASLRQPKEKSDRANPEVLDWHRSQCPW